MAKDSAIFYRLCVTVAGLSWALAAHADGIPFTLLHTNDLHSHFRGENTPLSLGGVARIRTAVKNIRARVPRSLFVDGGDWSEGNIYFTEGGGTETLRMMDFLGYDVAVVGNHDWLNGPGHLVGLVRDSGVKLNVIAANLGLDSYAGRDELRRYIPPYVIKDVGGAKVAFIGLLTYEFIYDSFFTPVKITEPFAVARELARELKKQVDAVIVISHNSVAVNKGILEAAPDVDLVIGAHDHVKLTKPVVVERKGKPPAWIVETGSWGRYLGRVDMRINKGSLTLDSYNLIQIDSAIPEDQETVARVEKLEQAIESRLGPIFHDHVGDSKLELHRGGLDSPMGDFVTDAYRDATGADAAMDQINFIYGELHAGEIRTADVFNANPGVYHPALGTSWKLHTINLRGKTLNWILNLLYGNKKLSQYASLNLSGMRIELNPKMEPKVENDELDARLLFTRNGFSDLATPLDGTTSQLQRILIGGNELNVDSTYKVAIAGGIVDAIRFLNGLLPNSVPTDSLRDTGMEDWRVLEKYVRKLSPLTADKVKSGDRLVTVQPDLGVSYDDVSALNSRVRATVRNNGLTASGAGTTIRLLVNKNGVDYSQDPVYIDAAQARSIPSLAPGEAKTVEWDAIVLPEDRGVRAVTVRLEGNAGEFNRSNDEVTRWF